MANNCMCGYEISCPDKAALEELYNKMNSWLSLNKDEHAKNMWTFVEGSKIGYYDQESEKLAMIGQLPNRTYNTRGYIYEISITDNTIYIDSDHAWQPAPELFYDIAKEFLPEGEFTYFGCEPAGEVFVTNDPAKEKMIYMDPINDPAYEYENQIDMFMNKEKVVEVLQKLLNTSETDYDLILQEYYNSDYEGCFSIHEWTYEEQYGYFENENIKKESTRTIDTLLRK